MAHLLMRLFEKWPALNALAPSILYVYIDVDRADCSPPWGGRTLEGNEGEKGNSSFAARRVEYYYVVFSVRGPASSPGFPTFLIVRSRNAVTFLLEEFAIIREDYANREESLGWIFRSVCDQVFFFYSTGTNFISKVSSTESKIFQLKKNYIYVNRKERLTNFRLLIN